MGFILKWANNVEHATFLVSTDNFYPPGKIFTSVNMVLRFLILSRTSSRVWDLVRILFFYKMQAALVGISSVAHSPAPCLTRSNMVESKIPHMPNCGLHFLI